YNLKNVIAFLTDSKLEEVRAEFIKRISTTVISQLLDDLLHQRILGDEELEEVNVKNKRQDQARMLIDNVRRKGPEASRLLIDFLLARDTYLAEQLGLQNVPAD
uniref:CARD domain-containing protein n=1 Tax=Laticauda laticaudata TaxID=8630 RepID=A0A8C5RM89_LATLA